MTDTLIAPIAYSSRRIARPRYHANDHSRDELEVLLELMTITDARGAGASLDVEGFELVPHQSAVTDFADPAEVWNIHRDEISELVRERSGADVVLVNAPGLLRFSEKSGKAGSLNNSLPARFAHVDISDATAAEFAARSAPDGQSCVRVANYNVWRALSVPPQDVPLALCDARSVAAEDLIKADAVFDEAGKPDWSFEGLVVAHNPAHRWHWFSDMHITEALIFKTNDSDPSRAHHVPHVAFDHPSCPPDAVPRMSIEMRAMAFWF